MLVAAAAARRVVAARAEALGERRRRVDGRRCQLEGEHVPTEARPAPPGPPRAARPLFLAPCARRRRAASQPTPPRPPASPRTVTLHSNNSIEAPPSNSTLAHRFARVISADCRLFSRHPRAYHKSESRRDDGPSAMWPCRGNQRHHHHHQRHARVGKNARQPQDGSVSNGSRIIGAPQYAGRAQYPAGKDSLSLSFAAVLDAPPYSERSSGRQALFLARHFFIIFSGSGALGRPSFCVLLGIHADAGADAGANSHGPGRAHANRVSARRICIHSAFIFCLISPAASRQLYARALLMLGLIGFSSENWRAKLQATKEHKARRGTTREKRCRRQRQSSSSCAHNQAAALSSPFNPCGLVRHDSAGPPSRSSAPVFPLLTRAGACCRDIGSGRGRMGNLPVRLGPFLFHAYHVPDAT